MLFVYNNGVSIEQRNTVAEENTLVDSKDSALLFSKGEKCLNDGHFAEAVSFFKQVAACGDKSGPLQFNLGLAYVLDGKIEYGMDALGRTVDEDGDLDLSLVRFANPKLTAQVADLLKKSVENSTDLKFMVKAAASFLVLNRFPEAQAALDELGGQDSLLPQLFLWHSLALNKLGKFSEACQAAEKYCSRHNDDAYGFYALGLARFNLKETAKAIDAYRKALGIVPGHIKASLRLAQAYMLAEQYSQVESILRELLEQHPVCIEAYFGLGKCLEKQYRLDEAADYLSKSADLAPEAAEYQLAAGQALKGLGQNAKALDYFHKAAALCPNESEVHYCLGTVLSSLERFSEAVAELEKASKLDPRSSYTFYALGVVYAKLSYFDKAIAAFGKALELNPKAQEARYEIGLLHYRNASYEEAVKELEAYSKFYPLDGRSRYYIGLSYRALGRLKEAEQLLLEAMKDSTSQEQQIYFDSADSLQKGQTSASLHTLAEAALRDLPDRKSDFFEASMLQFFGTKAIRLHQAIQEEREYSSNVEDSLFQFMSSLSALTDLRDAYCQSHSQRVAAIADILAGAFELGEELKNGIHVGACLHDSGKMALPDVAMYYADNPDNDADIKECNELYKQHTLLGYENFSAMPFPDGVLEAIQYHHEMWDGSGFPNGLKGKAIPWAAQIVGLADYYERLLTKGDAHGVCTQEAALQRIKKGAGTLFDPELVKRFELEFGKINVKLESLSD